MLIVDSASLDLTESSFSEVWGVMGLTSTIRPPEDPVLLKFSVFRAGAERDREMVPSLIGICKI